MGMRLFGIFYLIILTSVTIYALNNYKIFLKSFKVLTVLLVIITVKEFLSKYVYHYNYDGNYLNHCLLTLTLILNLYIYLPQWSGNKKLKIIVSVISILFACLAVLNSVFLQNLYLTPSNGLILLCLQMVLLSLLSFKIIINSPANESIYMKPLFWLSVSNLFFYTVVYLIFAFFHFYKEVGKIGSWLPLILSMANCLLYIGYGISIYVHKKRINV